MAIQSIKVIGIAGSLREGSYNRGLIRASQDLAAPFLTIEPFDLRGSRSMIKISKSKGTRQRYEP